MAGPYYASEESGEWQEGEGLASEEEVGNRVLTSAQFPLLPKGGKDHIDVSLFLLLKMSTGPFVTCYPLGDPIYIQPESTYRWPPQAIRGILKYCFSDFNAHENLQWIW